MFIKNFSSINKDKIVLVNDGTKDSSGKIAMQYAKQYKEKIIYLEKENGGLSDARNYGLAYAKGEYIAFLDSDDYIEKDAYEKMYEKAKQYLLNEEKRSIYMKVVLREIELLIQGIDKDIIVMAKLVELKTYLEKLND